MAGLSREAADVGSHLTDPEVSKCPFPFYGRLHDADRRAHREPQIGWAVTGYEEVLALAKDPERFSSQWQGLEGSDLMGVSTEPYSDEVRELIAQYPYQMPNTLLVADGAPHTRQRALFTKALHHRRVQEMAPSITAIVDGLIDGFIDRGSVEFMKELAEPIPSNVISDALGIPKADVPKFKTWSDRFIWGLIEPLDNDRRAIVARTIIEYQRYMVAMFEERRRSPTDDLLSAIVNAEMATVGEDAEIEGPRSFTNAEILGLLTQVIAGGHHTTAGLIGNAMAQLLADPQLMAEVRADHDLIPDLLEETLRYESPVQCTFRRAMDDVTVADEQIPAGSTVISMWGAANQDPRKFENPRTFDIRRPQLRRHLAFGQGPHFCIGAGLARLDSRIAFERILTRMDDIRVAEGQELERHVSFSSRAYARMPLTFRKVA